MTANRTRAHVVVFHHTSNPAHIHREIVRGQPDCDSAVIAFKADCLSIVQVTDCYWLADGDAVEERADTLAWVEIPDERRAPYIDAAWNQHGFFTDGDVSIQYENNEYVVFGAAIVGRFKTLDDAKRAAQDYHDETPRLQVIDLRQSAFGTTVYLGRKGLYVESLAEQLGVTGDEIVERLIAGEEFCLKAHYASPHRGEYSEDIKIIRLLPAGGPESAEELITVTEVPAEAESALRAFTATLNPDGSTRLILGTTVVATVANGPEGALVMTALMMGLQRIEATLYDVDRAHYLVGDAGQLSQEG